MLRTEVAFARGAVSLGSLHLCSLSERSSSRTMLSAGDEDRPNSSSSSLAHYLSLSRLRSLARPATMPVMRHGQRQNAILNSPIVRSFIRPVRAILPTSTKTASEGAVAGQNGANGADGARMTGGEGEEEGDWLIPTQPVSGSSADVKGKKRAREEDEAGDEPAKTAVEYDAAAGTRYGEVVRYTSGNLPDELEKCESRFVAFFSAVFAR